jgi:ABC-type dipeptide/oligopeptide/nickel transport system permease subunit
VVYGSRYDLFIAVTVVGLFSGGGDVYRQHIGVPGGKIDNLIMRLMDMLAFPALSWPGLCGRLSPTLMTLVIALSIRFVPMYARLVRSEDVRGTGQRVCGGAQAIGSAQTRLVFRHLLPNSLAPHHAVHHECLLGRP